MEQARRLFKTEQVFLLTASCFSFVLVPARPQVSAVFTFSRRYLNINHSFTEAEPESSVLPRTLRSISTVLRLPFFY